MSTAEAVCDGRGVLGEMPVCAGCGSTEVEVGAIGHMIYGSVPDQCGPIEIVPVPCSGCVNCQPREEPEADAVAAARCTTTDGHHFYRCVICEAVMDTPLAGLLEVPAEAPRIAELEAALREVYEDQGLADWLVGEDDDYVGFELHRRKLVQRVTRLLAPSAEKESGEPDVS